MGKLMGETYVGCGSKTQGLGTGLERIDLTSDDPGKRTPGRGEEENVDGNKSDTGLLGCGIIDDDVTIGVLASSRGAKNSHNELTDAHTDGTPEEKWATTKLVDGPETGQGGHDVNDRGDDLDREGVADAGVLEVLGSVIEDEVDACQLL